MTNKVQMYQHDVVRLAALLDTIHYDKEKPVEIEVDSSSGIGSVGVVHIPVKLNSLPGTFTYTLWDQESW